MQAHHPDDAQLARARVGDDALDAARLEDDRGEAGRLEHFGVHLLVTILVAGRGPGRVDGDLAGGLAGLGVESDRARRQHHRPMHLVEGGVEGEADRARGRIEHDDAFRCQGRKGDGRAKEQGQSEKRARHGGSSSQGRRDDEIFTGPAEVPVPGQVDTDG